MKKTASVVLALNLIMWGAAGFGWASEESKHRIRPPVVSGLFYPAAPDELRQMVQSLIKEAGGVRVQEKIRGLVSPHAGYVYSGIVAAAGFGQIDPNYKRVILLGSSHRIPLKAPSIPDVDAYRTPLGDVALAKIAVNLRNTSGFESVSQAHTREHSLEVQLPFLQVLLHEFEIVPILINSSDPKVLAMAIEPFVDEDTLVVASSDLSHYHPYETAKTLDRICTNAVPACQFSEMPRCEACGKRSPCTTNPRFSNKLHATVRRLPT